MIHFTLTRLVLSHLHSLEDLGHDPFAARVEVERLLVPLADARAIRHNVARLVGPRVAVVRGPPHVRRVAMRRARVAAIGEERQRLARP